MKIWFAKLTAIILAAGVSGQLAWARDPSSLKIGAVFSLSGAQASYGNDSVEGMELALDMVRVTDPGLAQHIAVVKEDDKSSPIDAVVAAKKLLSIDQVDLIFGSESSSQTLSMSAAVMGAGKVLVTPAATNPTVTQKGDRIFRTCFSDPFQGSVAANFALNHLKKKKAAILLDHKSDYSLGFAEYFEKGFKAGGGEIVAKEMYEAGKKDFTTQLTKIRAKNPEVLLLPGYYQEVGLIMKQAKQIGLKATLLGGDGWDSPALYQIAGAAAVQGHYFSTHFSVDDTDPSVQKFVGAYRKKFNKDPSAIAALGYDGMLVIVDAFKRAKSSDASKLARALATTQSLKGATGVITINAARDTEKDAVILETKADKAVFFTKISPSK